MQGSCENVDSYASLSDARLVLLAQHRDLDALRQIMQRGNQRLFRVARSVLNDDAEAEDAVQEAWLRIFSNLGSFSGEANLVTWATRIVLNECHSRPRRRRSNGDVKRIEEPRESESGAPRIPPHSSTNEPASDTPATQIREVLERTITSLPEALRVVLVMCDIEDRSIEETASLLDIPPEAVKARLHHARRLLRSSLHDVLSDALAEAFPFLDPHCEWLSETVLAHMLAKRGLRSSNTKGELT